MLKRSTCEIGKGCSMVVNRFMGGVVWGKGRAFCKMHCSSKACIKRWEGSNKDLRIGVVGLFGIWHAQGGRAKW